MTYPQRDEHGNAASTVFACLIVLAILYWWLASWRWQLVHPRANDMTLLTHCWKVLTWQTVERFQ